MSSQDEQYFLFEIRLKKLQTRQAYNRIYEKSSLSHFDSYYQWLIKKLEIPSEGRFLDISCGGGELIRLSSLHGLEVVGLDFSEVVIRKAKRRLSSQEGLVVGVGEELPFPDDSFDYVTNIGSLEHFNDPALGVCEMARVLRSGGKAYILVPNTFSLSTNIWDAFRRGITVVDQQPIQRYGARMDWVNLLHSNGLKVCRTQKFERAWPQFLSDWNYYLRKPKEMIRLLASPFIPLNLAFCFMFTCEKK